MLVSFLILASAFLFVGRSVIGSTRRAAMTEVTADLAQNVRQYDAALGNGGYALWQSEELHSLLRSVSHASGYRLLLVDRAGTVLSCSESGCGHPGSVLPAAELQRAASESEGFMTDLGGLFHDRCYVLAAPVERAGEAGCAGYVLAAASGGAFTNAFRSFTNMFFIIGIIVLFIAVAMSFVAARRMARPLADMADAARRFAHGDFSVRVESGKHPGDEIGDLTRAFNAMADSLESSEERRRDFIANVSHELRTPMTTISGFADGILDGTIPRENQDRYLQTISSETKRLSRLVRRMLELAQLQHPDRQALLAQRFDARELLTRSLLRFEGKMNERRLDAELSLPEEAVFVRGDEDAIEQVVCNLLENAVKFAAPGTALGLSLLTQGDKAFVTVRDRGEDIPAGELDVIFERFHKTDRSRSLDREGLGLGLYIVRTILNNHYEDIAVRSENGLTEFTFTLTLAERGR